ncbi:hypothetical protein PR048_028056 [Dryococelus australis]|uniref:Uncharacterized protein n=1 Tax=Dryococelus australis TaxID=614101 RepID=A0ABQ9GI61_9NEOP|nr:hypothetical protein PR048_028056 [Dryococelus australis]
MNLHYVSPYFWYFLKITFFLLIGKKDSHDDTSLSQLLQIEVETLNRDLEVLSNDNKNKSEELKRLSERFHNEKCALEAELKCVSSKVQSLSHMNDYLKEQVRVVSEEKDVVMKGIESIKTNNFELNQLVESIGSERDECLHSVEKLNAEKSKLSKLINALNSSKTTILEENVSLKSEKQHLNECLKKLTCERDSLRDSVTLAETRLSRLLQQSLEVLQNLEHSVENLSVQYNDVTDDKKIELVEIISTLDDVLSKLCTILNTQSCKPCVCIKGADISVGQEIDCSKFVSFERAEEKGVFTQEPAVLSALLNKLSDVAVAFKSVGNSSEETVLLNRIIHYLNVNISVLDSEVAKQCASTYRINKELIDVETMPCLEQKLKLDNLNCESEILQDKANSSLEDNTISVQSNSLKQYIGTQTESTMEEICEKCVQTDVCSLDSSSFTNSFIQDNEKVIKKTEDSNLQEYDNENEEVHVKTLKDQLQVLRVKYQESLEKLKCTERELELLQSVVNEKDADMNKILDILLCFDVKNSKNVMNKVFEKLKKDKASCEVGSIDEAVGNFLSQNFIEQLAPTEKSECANIISVHDGDILTNSDASASQTCVQNILDLQKMVFDKKTEILHLNELKSLSETQSSIISKQEREICFLNKTIEELTKAASGSENKIVYKKTELSCDTADSSCSRVAEDEHEISAGDEYESEISETEKEDQACCKLTEQNSQLLTTCNKQEDEMYNLQKLLDERNNEIENLKTELQDIKENFEDHNRSELLKLVEEKTNEIEQYKADIEALKLGNTKVSEIFQQEIVDRNEKVDNCEMKVEDAENLSTVVEPELLQKQKIIDEQKDEINNYRQKVVDVQNQLEQLSHQLSEKEEITTKLYSDINNHKQQIADFEQHYQELENQVRENQQLIADKDCEIESWQKKFKGIEEQLRRIEVDFLEKEEMCFEKIKEIEALQKEIGELQEKYSEIEQKFTKEQQRVSDRDTEVEKLSNGIVERNSKIESCMREIEDIKNHLRETVAQKDFEIEEHKKESLNMQRNLDEVRNNISEEKHLFEQKDKDTENHRKQIENIMQQCMEAGIKLAEKQQIINEMSQNIEEYKRNIMNMQEHFNGTERIQQKSIDDMRGEIERLRNDLAIATASFTDKTTGLNIVKEELCSLKSANSSLTKTIDDMSAELDYTKLEAANKEETLKERIQEIEKGEGKGIENITWRSTRALVLMRNKDEAAFC